MTGTKEYIGIIEEIKENIRVSRYRAARSVNRELLLLYFNIGGILSGKVMEENWGARVLDRISKDIQDEFPGIRGFSVRNLKNMRQFHENYAFLDFRPTVSTQIGQTLSAQIRPCREKELELAIGQTLSAQIGHPEISPTVSGQINDISISHEMDKGGMRTDEFVAVFLSLGFSHHIYLIQKCPDMKERYFYMTSAVRYQWSYRVLQYHIDSDLYNRKGKMISTFDRTLPIEIKKHAIEAFKDEYLLSFVNVHEDDEEAVLESGIVNNVKKFLMSLGNGFTFIGNQYRLVVGGDEFFVDLLFFHRFLQAMVAIELKAGKFKPEYAGKMNFYLTALDELVRLPHENPSIGIILCKEKNNAIVEFAFRDLDKPVGVATYVLRKRLPDHLKKYLPKPQDLKKILENSNGDR